MTKYEPPFLYTRTKEVMTIYAVYLDLYFIENLILDTLVLSLTSVLWNKRIRWKRIIVAAILGTMIACIILILKIQGGLLFTACNMLQGMVVVKTAYRKLSVHELLRGTLYFYTISLVFSKLYEGLRVALGEAHGMAISVGAFVIISMAVKYLKYCKRKEDGDVFYDVEILGKGQRLQVKALYDTGNTLTEPISGKPVSIVEKTYMEEILKLEEGYEYKCIPFRSIGKENGVIMGLEVDGLLIRKNDECIEKYGEIVALYDGQLSSDGSFGMILHQGLI